MILAIRWRQVLHNFTCDPERARARVANNWQPTALAPAPQAFYRAIGHNPIARLVALRVPYCRAAAAPDVVGNPQRHPRSRGHSNHCLLQRWLMLVPWHFAEDAIDACGEIDAGGRIALRFRQSRPGSGGHIRQPAWQQILTHDRARAVGDRRERTVPEKSCRRASATDREARDTLYWAELPRNRRRDSLRARSMLEVAELFHQYPGIDAHRTSNATRPV